jgi:hypothetical protein
VALKEWKVEVRLPLLSISGTWAPNADEKKAAWELYVELITRVPVADLKPDEGSLREALTSLHSIFGTTRSILKCYGPKIATPKDDGKLSFGYLAVALLNQGIRPLLSKWHPLLASYETKCPPGSSPIEHERRWEQAQELRETLLALRSSLVQYADLLAEAAGVPPLSVPTEDT